jgi:catechol 2,3-dioxygenase-like lactoylglutathione lyase family enzyme
MLGNLQVGASLAVKDMQRARQFYEQTLGLTPMQESDTFLSYTCGNGTAFSIYPSAFAGTAQNTVMGWATDNFDAVIADLRARGVVFEDYDMPDIKTVNGVMEAEGARVAWFKDPDGNILSLNEGM